MTVKISIKSSLVIPISSVMMSPLSTKTSFLQILPKPSRIFKPIKVAKILPNKFCQERKEKISKKVLLLAYLIRSKIRRLLIVWKLLKNIGVF